MSKNIKELIDALFLRLYWKVHGTRYILPTASNTEKKNHLKIHIIFKKCAFEILFIWLLPTRLFSFNVGTAKTFFKEYECKLKIFIRIYLIVAWVIVSEYLMFSV